ncbi:P-loop NTPase fold protein [Asticcacaulis solisilvae]|uniref:P-loop NTPase fold protein n=1 Tax=Asticcacaulis solisilvae TaxID=1217274 RepID=UPI003FD7D0FD
MGDSHIERIWSEDLFGRRQEAAQLEAYIESIAQQEMTRVNGRAYVIAIDAPYGVGKTFFLKCLAKQLELNHPTAFVDAWADDLLDEPLTALAATLKTALKPYLNNANVEKKWQKFLNTAGHLAKIAAVGAVKRGVGMFIGAMAADLIHEELIASETIKESLEDSLEDLGKDAPDGAIEALNLARGGALMAERIEKFQSGKAAVEGRPIGRRYS